MAQNHIVNRPENQCPTMKPQDRRPCNTKQCAHDDLNPAIAVANVTYVQTNPSKKKVNLKIGGQAQVFYGTQVKIKCPVRRFNRLVVCCRFHEYFDRLTKPCGVNHESDSLFSMSLCHSSIVACSLAHEVNF